MNVLLVYGTSEGQTGKVARFVAERLRQRGHRVLTANAAESGFIPEPGTFDAVLIAASVHAGRYQRSVVEFARGHAAALRAKPNAFLSISLSAAGTDPGDRAGLEQCIADFIRDTGWRPARIHHVAGALRYRAYGLITRWLMRRIAARRRGPTDTRHDHELTDWAELGQFIDAFSAQEQAPVPMSTST